MKLNLLRFCWGLILLGLLPSNVVAQNSVQPELYSYQTFGNRGSSYTSVATGLGIYLKTDAGPQLCATLTNLSRSSVRPKKGERLWIGWVPEDTPVLSE